jgi:putative two-component system response regulator
MAAYCRLLAKAVGWSDERTDLLGVAATMHDTGKIGIPDAILKKAGKLDKAEWEVMKTHPRIGHNILIKGNSELFQLAAEISLNHHEKWDGSGYPQGLTGDKIPESARIVAIADVFDALTMKRPYKEAWPLDQVLTQIKAISSHHLETRLVETFITILPQILEEKSKWDAKS